MTLRRAWRNLKQIQASAALYPDAADGLRDIGSKAKPTEIR